MEIDYGLALDFIDDDGDERPYQLRFRKVRHDGDLGQLIAVIASRGRADNGTTMPISRANVSFEETESALKDWDQWAMLSPYIVSLSRIRARIIECGLA